MGGIQREREREREKVIIFKNKLNEHFDKLNYFEQMIRTFPNWTCPKKKVVILSCHKMGMLLLCNYVYNQRNIKNR